LALSYSVFEAARQWSEGGCTAFADEQRKAKIAAVTTSVPAAAALFLSVDNRPSFILMLTQSLQYPVNQAVNDTSSQCKASDI